MSIVHGFVKEFLSMKNLLLVFLGVSRIFTLTSFLKTS